MDERWRNPPFSNGLSGYAIAHSTYTILNLMVVTETVELSFPYVLVWLILTQVDDKIIIWVRGCILDFRVEAIGKTNELV